MLKKMFFGIIGLAVIIMGITAIGASQKQSDNQPTPAQAQAESQPTAPTAAIPQLEQQIVQTVTDFSQKYSAAPNEMAQGILRHQRAIALCKQLASLDGNGDPSLIKNWVGIISTLSSNNEGKGVLEVTIGDNISLGTWNNDLSDSSDNTMIPVNSPLLAKVAAMSEGQQVYFSGHLYTSKTDCMQETSITQEGSMKEPDFLFRFTDVRPASK